MLRVELRHKTLGLVVAAALLLGTLPAAGKTPLAPQHKKWLE